MPASPKDPLAIIEPRQEVAPLIGNDQLFTKEWWLFFYNTARIIQQITSNTFNLGSAEVGQLTFGLEDDAAGQGPAADGINAIRKFAVVLVPGSPYLAYFTPRLVPATDSTLDVLFSRDHGTTWNSIFPAGVANKAVFKAADLTPKKISTFATVKFAVGDLVRLDVLTNGGATDITFELRWK